MKRNDKTFKEMVARISSGELTRAKAAELYGINLGTLNVWISRSGVGKETRSPHKLHGAALGWASTDPNRAKALKEATDKVLSGDLSLDDATEKFKMEGVARATLARSVRAARVAAGETVKSVTSSKGRYKSLESLGISNSAPLASDKDNRAKRDLATLLAT